jgi:transposase
MKNRTSLFGLEITDSPYRFDKNPFDPEKIIYAAKFDWEEVWGGITMCPSCEEEDPKLYSWGTHDKFVKDTPIGLKPVGIEIEFQRYRCQECGGTFGTTHPHIKKNSNMTNALTQHIAIRARGPETQARIAETTGVPAPTVRKLLHKYFAPWPRREPLALGIDELYAGTGDPCTVITSLGGEGRDRVVFEVLPDRKYDDDEARDVGEELKTYLSGIEPGQKPLPVVTDMSGTFMKAVEQSDLQTTLILDRFHLARQATRTLGTVHSKLGISGTLQDTWEAQKAEIDGEDLGDRDGVQLHIDTETTLNLMESAYKAVLWYNWILTADISRDEAAQRLRRWRRELPLKVRGYFENTVLDTLDKSWDQILNYYDYEHTNSYNEAVNNIGKKLERLGAGYSNRTIRAKLLHNQSKAPPFFRKKIQHFYADSRVLGPIEDDPVRVGAGRRRGQIGVRVVGGLAVGMGGACLSPGSPRRGIVARRQDEAHRDEKSGEYSEEWGGSMHWGLGSEQKKHDHAPFSSYSS